MRDNACSSSASEAAGQVPVPPDREHAQNKAEGASGHGGSAEGQHQDSEQIEVGADGSRCAFDAEDKGAEEIDGEDVALLRVSLEACIVMFVVLCYFASGGEYMPKENSAGEIRSFVSDRYVKPARRRGDKRIRIVAGEVHKDLKLNNRVPNVCQVLASKKFQEENHVEIEESSGPPSGMGTRMTYVYRLLDEQSAAAAAKEDWFEKLRGLLTEEFKKVGGGEAFLRNERAHFCSNEGRK